MTQADTATAVRMSLDSEPVGTGQAEATPEALQARCMFCGGHADVLVVLAAFESALLLGCGYCAEVLGKRAAS